MDGMPNKSGLIHKVADVMLCYHDHTERTQFAVTHLGKSKMILGLCWLWQHNPEVYWAMNEVKMSRCPTHHCTCVQEVAEECKVHKAESAKIHTCWAGLLPTSVEDVTDNESLDLPDLPDLLPNPDSEENGDNESLEEGNRTFMASIPTEAEFIHVVQTTSQHLAEAFHRNTIPKLFHNSVLTHIHNFEDVFSKALFNTLPTQKLWDHPIKLIPGAKPSQTL
jgi:hypothetical protein